MRVTPVAVMAFLCLPSSAFAQAAAPASLSAVGGVAPSPTATLSYMRGQVEVSSGAGPTGETHAARPGETLVRGARLRVGEDGVAEVTLANGAVLEVGERSNVTMFTSPMPAPPDQPPSTTTTLTRGSIHVRMAPGAAAHPPALIPLATASVTAFVGRSDAVVSADLGGHITRVGVLRGRMRVRANTREYILRAGTGSVEEFGRPPMPYHQLLAQPQWLSTPPLRVVSGGEPVDVQATYGYPASAAAPVSAWRVQVAHDEAFHDLISDARAAGTSTRWQGTALAPGSYYVRVVAFDNERFESLASAVVRVQVDAPHVLPGQLAPAGSFGRQAAVHIPDGFYCGLDGGRLLPAAGAVRLTPGRTHALRCATNPDGRDARVMTIRPEQAGPLVHRVRMRSVSYGETVMGLQLADAERRGVPYAEVTATADQGVTIEVMREEAERGEYTAAVHWPRGVNRAHFRFTVNGAETFEEDVAQGD